MHSEHSLSNDLTSLDNVPSHTPVGVTDSGRIRIGGGCQFLSPTVSVKEILDTRRIKIGGGCRIFAASNQRG